MSSFLKKYPLLKRRKAAFLYRKSREIIHKKKYPRPFQKMTYKFREGKIKMVPLGKKREFRGMKVDWEARKPRIAFRDGKLFLVDLRKPKKKKKTIPTKRIEGLERVTKRYRKAPEKKWLGPYPSPLGDDLIISMEAKYPILDEMYNIKFVTCMRTIYERLYAECIDLIEKYTPEDTGYLKKSLKESVSEKYSNLPKIRDKQPLLQVWLYAKPDYAGIVNKMATMNEKPHVRHPPYYGYYIGKSGRILNDPTAIGSFYNFILLNARKKAKKFVEEELRILAIDTGFTYRAVKYMFKVKYK